MPVRDLVWHCVVGYLYDGRTHFLRLCRSAFGGSDLGPTPERIEVR